MAARASNIDGIDQQHVGPRILGDVRRVRIDRNNDPSYMAIPNRYFEGIQGLPSGPFTGRGVGPGYQSSAAFYAVHPLTPYIQVDVHGGYTAAAGHYLYTARSFPKNAEPHRVHHRAYRASRRPGGHGEAGSSFVAPRRLEPARGR